MPTSKSGFEVEVHADGTCDVTRDRRSFFYDCADVDEAKSIIRRRHGRGVDFVLVEPDGYRTIERT